MKALPKKVYLGPDWDIAVTIIDPVTMGAAFPDGTAGVWDKEKKTILILKNISRERQWSVYCEELAHALIDKLADKGH